MDKKKSLLNICTAIFFKVVLLVLSLLTKRYLIKLIGNDANGLNSLYLSIIGFLTIADLGIGSAISFSMYAPITNGDNEKVSALYQLFIKIYRIIGIIILVAGVCLMPFLPYLAKGYSSNYNLYLTFAIMLASVFIEYMFSAKTSLIDAYKNNYITTTITSVTSVVRHLLQIMVLFVFKSFELYLLCRLVSSTLHWILTEIYTRKHYKDIIKTKASVDSETKKDIVKNTKAMFMHKIGTLLVNTADSIIISAFIGVVLLGKYSNYTVIMTSMTGVLTLFFTPLTSIMGHMCVKGDINEEKKYFNFLYCFNFILGAIFFLGYYAVIDNVIAWFFGADLVLDKSISFIITINYFIQFMRQTVLLFRDATGTFYHDRFKPVIEGVLNIVLSILLVNYIGVVGVIVATIVTNLLICHVIEPYVLYKNVFKQAPKKHYLLNYCLIFLFIGMLFILHLVLQSHTNNFVELIINGFIAVALAMVPCILIIIFNKDFRLMIKKLFNGLKSKLLKNKKEVISEEQK